jgi:membrane dipeptidase
LTLETYPDQLDSVCQLAENARHAAIGTDLDDGHEIEQSLQDRDTIADLQRLAAMCGVHGCSEAEIEAAGHGRWLRFFHSS